MNVSNSSLDSAKALKEAARIKKIEAFLASLVLLTGIAVGISVINRGIWLDEFAEIYTSRYGDSFQDFIQNLSEDIHPILHYMLLYTANKLGITHVDHLRMLNLLGVPLAVWALWWTLKQEKAMAPAGAAPGFTASQAFAVIALYASSAMFSNYLAEARCYFLVISSSVAAALVWRVLMAREGWENGALSRYLAWGFSLAILVNLHYFATFFGGLLTVALLVRHVLLREWRRMSIIAVIAALAAAPSLVMGYFQYVKQLETEFTNVSWITTTSKGALSIYLDVLAGSVGYNIPVAIALFVAAYAFFRRWKDGALERFPEKCTPVFRKKARQNKRLEPRSDSIGAEKALSAGARLPGRDAVLVLVVAAFFGLIFLHNLWRPLVIGRYLFAACGPVIVLAAVAAAGPLVPRWPVPAMCVFALAVQIRGGMEGQYDRPGWAASASAVAHAVGACPKTSVYAFPFWDEALFGMTYYAERYRFTFKTVAAGDVVPRQDACPNIIWIEHADELLNAGTYAFPNNLPVEQILEKLKVKAQGTVQAEYIKSGLLIWVR